jgi:sodium/proline symporter
MMVASSIILVSLGTYVASQFQGAGKAFQETFGLSMVGSIILGTLIVLVYTMLGGFWAVSVTDTLQGLLMAASAILIPGAAVVAVGGPHTLLESLWPEASAPWTALFGGLPLFGGIGFVLGLFGIGLGYPGQPHVVNRFMAMKEGPQVLKRARRIAVLWALVVYAGMLLLGWSGRVLLPSLNDPEVVFFSLTHHLFPPIVSGLVLAGVLSAIMSTADSQLLVASSSVTHDLGLGKQFGLSLLARSRIVVVALSLAAMVGALYGTPEIFSRVLFAWAAMGCAFGPVLLLLTLKGSVKGRNRLLAISLGFCLSIGSFYVFPATSSWKGFFERVFPFLVALVVTWSGSQQKASPPPA